MKLFENRVGRPTNEIKEKRKIFIVSIVCISFLILFCTSLYLYGSINNKASIFSRPIVLYVDDLLGSRAVKGTNIKVRARFSYIGTKTYYYDIKETLNDKKLIIDGKTCNMVPNDKKVYFSFELNEDETRFETTVYSDSNCTNELSSFNSRKYYLKSSGNKIKITTKKRANTTNIKTTTTKKVTSTVKDITMSKYNDSWNIGGEGVATVNLRKSNSFSVKSSNPKVMRVKKINSTQYKIVAIAPGKATITAKSSSGDKVSYTYKVKEYEYLDNSRLEKGVKSEKTYNGIKVVVEKGCNNLVINRYISDIKELPSYAVKPTKAIYFSTDKTFNKLTNSNNQVGQAMMGRMYIDIKCNKYHELVLTHEIAHNIDYYYKLFTGEDYISSDKVYSKLFDKYNGKVLRTYSFTNEKEFFADSYSYYFHRYVAKTNSALVGVGRNWKYNNEIKKEIENTIKIIKNLEW